MGVYAYERVLMHIREMMAKGEIRQGERLPPERELAERFGVSRHSLRQALQSLGERGLVIRRQGSGTHLMADSEDILARELACLLTGSGSRMDALLEFRLMLEPGIAAFAARRISGDRLAQLEQLVDMQATGERGFGDLDARFHGLLAEATENVIVREVMVSLAVILDESRSPVWEHPERAACSLEGHRAILDALKSRDEYAAQKAMQDHLESIRRTMFCNARQEGQGQVLIQDGFKYLNGVQKK
ncbi:FadR/GntR family transcriptional regulator [Desulfobotulus mexicanus]|uniref:FadR family transcriptional regulator n=1 Tax=Desulfobotulus mexicanus TaxID=2586642 RepID=A0A5S5MD52_9BACT|nr:FadR/GntR family transcriptional regulator [Desulfobotulus mexicanus]TYT73644.1 FadR family transcriptional regulator [Desulfobotulus mexicanus]